MERLAASVVEESKPQSLLSKMRKGGVLSFGHFDKRVPALEPYVYLAVGILVSIIVTFTKIGAVFKGEATWGDMFHQQSIIWIVLAVFAILTFLGLGYKD